MFTCTYNKVHEITSLSIIKFSHTNFVMPSNITKEELELLANPYDGKVSNWDSDCIADDFSPPLKVQAYCEDRDKHMNWNRNVSVRSSMKNLLKMKSSKKKFGEIPNKKNVINILLSRQNVTKLRERRSICSMSRQGRKRSWLPRLKGFLIMMSTPKFPHLLLQTALLWKSQKLHLLLRRSSLFKRMP